MTQTKIRDIFSLMPEEKDDNIDPLILAEFQLTRAELGYLIYKHGHKIATVDSIKPFRTFLSKRFKRIAKTDLVYPHAYDQAATRLCIQVAETLATQLCKDHLFINREGDKKRWIYGLLMPTVDFSYHASIPISKLKLNEFILTDDDKDFIPVFIIMMEAGNTHCIDFTAHTLRSNHRYCVRPLTKSEQERLLSHSPEVKSYHHAIQQSIAIQTQSIGDVLKNFYENDALHDGSMMQQILKYIETLNQEQKNKLYAMSAYCSQRGEDGTFKDVVDDFGEGKSRIQAAHINLQAFLHRHQFSFLFSEKQKLMDPLILATSTFKNAIKSHIHAKPTYGIEAHQRLIDQVYSQKAFYTAIKVMYTAKPLADYLQAMPIEKIPVFTRLLSDEKLNNLFNDPDESPLHLARIWCHLSSTQKKYLVETIDQSDRLQCILNHQSSQGKRTDYAIAIHSLKTIFRSRGTENTVLVHHLLNQMNAISRHMKTSELHVLTELVLRSTLRLDKPYHETNNVYYAQIVNKLREHSYGNTLLSKIFRLYRMLHERHHAMTPERTHLPSLTYHFFARSVQKNLLTAQECPDSYTPLLSGKYKPDI